MKAVIQLRYRASLHARLLTPVGNNRQKLDHCRHHGAGPARCFDSTLTIKPYHWLLRARRDVEEFTALKPSVAILSVCSLMAS